MTNTIKKIIGTLIFGGILLGATPNAAFAQNSTTLNLGATVGDLINLGPPSHNNGFVGGNGNYSVTFVPDSQGLMPMQIYDLTWDNAVITVPHRLKLYSANGGMVSSASNTPAPNGFYNRLGYNAFLGWLTPGGGVDLDGWVNLVTLNDNTPPGYTQEFNVAIGKSGTFLLQVHLNIDAASPKRLVSGTYTDTLIATISPNP